MLFPVKYLPILFAVAIVFPTIVHAQSQGWAQRDFRTIHGGILDRQVNPLPATNVFPEDIPKFTYDGSQPIFRLSQQNSTLSLPAEILPPELNNYSSSIHDQDGLYLDEDQIFLSRPKLADHKPGYLKTVSLDSTWIAGSGDNIGMTDVLATASFGFPHPTRQSPLMITPGYGMHFLVGPESFQAPATLYDVYLTTRWITKLNQQWGVFMSVTAGYYTDFQNNDSDALRISGMAFAAYNWSPEVQLIMGAVYLNRDDYKILPAVGLIWDFTDDHRLELIFPRPRYLQLWSHGPNYEDWWYISGEVGGGTWAVEHPIDSKDFLTLTDYRFLIGLERKRNGGGKSFLEIGYIFGRKFEYRNDPSKLDMDGTLMLRSGWWF
ncbi:MAG: hypothetical protein COA78_07200 [Blastopirellula sp.]|nr:MAG: hypothetical protein COA78_07200 [Blastopirellula sp.]